VPHGLLWEIEHAEPPTAHPRFREIPDLHGLPETVAEISRHI
jgi:putative hydrolase of the HAD superfamily